LLSAIRRRHSERRGEHLRWCAPLSFFLEQQSASNPSENRRTPTTDSKERRLQEAKRRGERDKGDFVSPPLSSPYFVLLVPNLPPPFFCCHGATQKCRCVSRRFCRFPNFGSWAFAYFCVAKLLRGLCSSCFVVSIHLFLGKACVCLFMTHDHDCRYCHCTEFVPACHRFINRILVVFVFFSTYIFFQLITKWLHFS
jgi:hypothetical protein